MPVTQRAQFTGAPLAEISCDANTLNASCENADGLCVNVALDRCNDKVMSYVTMTAGLI